MCTKYYYFISRLIFYSVSLCKLLSSACTLSDDATVV